jgi:Flp pilus assembly protein TadB
LIRSVRPGQHGRLRLSLVRERLNMAAKLKAHTARSASAGLLCCLPLVVGIGFYILKPEYVRVVDGSRGHQVFHLRHHL